MSTAELEKVSNLSFEEAMRELETVVKKLETGQASLETSIAEYEKGMALRKHCEQKLQEAKMKIDKITKTPAGEVTLAAFTPE